RGEQNKLVCFLSRGAAYLQSQIKVASREENKTNSFVFYPEAQPTFNRRLKLQAERRTKQTRLFFIPRRSLSSLYGRCCKDCGIFTTFAFRILLHLQEQTS
ncbi:MAG: hypothetical protein J6U22_04840, partial [Bacteroidaceae bacterium]|nr:hypothetical protein [Bacteroidaceae bacterium]